MKKSGIYIAALALILVKTSLLAQTFATNALWFNAAGQIAQAAPETFADVINNFTIELWARPTSNRVVTAETTSGFAGIGGQRYAVFPELATNAYTEPFHASAGISIGLNGITVAEHSAGYLPTVLVYNAPITGWNHIAVVYSNHVPSLYLNGKWVHTGLEGDRAFIHPSAIFSDGNSNYGTYYGLLDQVRIWSVALDEATIRSNMHQFVIPSSTNLLAYYPFDETSGTNFTDWSGYNRHGTMSAGIQRIASQVVLGNPPTVTTLPPGSVDPFGVAVGGIVFPNDYDTRWWIEHGTSTNSFTTPFTLSIGTTPTTNSFVFNSLVPGVTNYYRAVASNVVGIAYGQTLTVVLPPVYSALPSPMPKLLRGKAVAADFNGDGKMDLLVNGLNGPTAVTELWTNNGSANFSLFKSLTGTFDGDVSAADYDNDGWLDLLITGVAPVTPTTLLYRNLQGTNFALISTSLPGLSFSAISWGDINGDGRRDLLLTGITNGVPHTDVWRNLGQGGFARMNLPLPQISDGDSRFFDIDYDGDLDIALSGRTSLGDPLCQFWLNNGMGTFINMNTGLTLPQFSGSFHFHNTDFSGPPDPILVGDTQSGPILQMFEYTAFNSNYFLVRDLTGKHNATSVLTESDIGSTPDLLCAGELISEGASTNVFLSLFTSHLRLMDRGLTQPAVAEGSLVATDFDGNGYADIFMQGRTANGMATNRLMSGFVHPFTALPPSAPSALKSVVASNHVTLSWSSSETFVPFNLRVGTTPGGINVVSPQTVIGNSKLLLPAYEDLSSATNFVLRGLPAGTYYWSVQGVRASSLASAFATEQTFTIVDSPRPRITNFSRTSNSVSLQFTHTGHPAYSVLVSTNLTQWIFLGTAQEITPGVFGFTDLTATTTGQRYYQIRMP